ncbi:154_t:CDS:2, partial [Paraglomus occultum]
EVQMEDLEVIRTINDKIKKEEQMRQAAVRLKSNSDNPAVRTQCEQSIMVMQRNIDYLRSELEKVQLKHQNLSTSGIPPHPNQGQNMPVQSHRGVDPNATQDNNGANSRKPVLSNLDLIKSDTPMTTQKVSLKLHELEFKLGVERKLMEGSQKMANAVVFQDPKNKKSIAEVAGKMIESKEKISLLSRSLNNYKKLYITGINDEDETSNDDNDIYRLTPGLRRRMT